MIDLEALVREELSRIVASTDVPGVEVAVTAGGYVVDAAHGVINTATQYPVGRETLFPIQSITKVFTATLIMQLVDAGRVRLNAPVQEYLPEFHTQDLEASSEITVQHLLTHTGGFEGDLWAPTTSKPDALDRFVRDLVGDAIQYNRPGVVFSYCSAGFGVLGRLVEVMRGSTYENALRTFLLGPLGVTRAAFSATQALAFATAIGHVRANPLSPLVPTRQWALMPPSNPAAGNQLAMNARGLLTLGQLFLSGGVTSSGERLLSRESATQMLRPNIKHRSRVGTESWQALGWRLPRPGIAEHGGGAPGVAALMTIAPDRDVAVVVLTNSDTGGGLASRLSDALVSELAGVEPAPVPAAPTLKVLVSDAAQYTGVYANRQTQFDVTTASDGRLWLTEQPRHEAAQMNRTAGSAARATRNEIRLNGDGTFSVVAGNQATRSVSFLDPSPDGAFRQLAGERVALRQDVPPVSPSESGESA